ncbi:MAG: alpha/beta hydrolase [Hyphomicrobiaceae bacterium]|nr:alpha/beta hydrolase [Hyphomicrobiaceae bacterium]
MTAFDPNIEYNARKTVPDHEKVSRRWDEEAAQYRAQATWDLDIPYGTGEREKYDFFPVDRPDAPLCVYIHGGYWRSRDRKTFSHIAKGLNAHGVSVAIPSYDLVPNVSVADIIEQMRAFLVKLWENTSTRPVVAGHSAGGHLTGAMLMTDWSSVEGAPDDLVTSAFALSGLYDLRPLLETDINDDLRLTPESAREASPMFWPVPRPDLKCVVAVGARESEPFRMQSRDIADTWKRAGVDTEYLEVADRDHFTVVNEFSTPGTALFERLVSTVEVHAAA